LQSSVYNPKIARFLIAILQNINRWCRHRRWANLF